MSLLAHSAPGLLAELDKARTEGHGSRLAFRRRGASVISDSLAGELRGKASSEVWIELDFHLMRTAGAFDVHELFGVGR